MALDSMQEIFEKAAAEQIPFWKVVLETDVEQRQVTEEQSMEKMGLTWQAMLESVTTYQGEERSRSGLVGGDGAKMRRYAESGGGLCGAYLREVVATALSVGESNACMRKIVAAPTAGAGTASAMAAGALASIQGGTVAQIGHAVAMALKNLLGLVCDPVAGLVEVPCVKRNVVGAVNAVSCADMAMAGIESRIPVDEVIDCMGDVGRRIPMELRETALGGLAVTPTGRAIKEQMNQA